MLQLPTTQGETKISLQGRPGPGYRVLQPNHPVGASTNNRVQLGYSVCLCCVVCCRYKVVTVSCRAVLNLCKSCKLPPSNSNSRRLLTSAQSLTTFWVLVGRGTPSLSLFTRPTISPARLSPFFFCVFCSRMQQVGLSPLRCC